jgi:hypothetical protein
MSGLPTAAADSQEQPADILPSASGPKSFLRRQAPDLLVLAAWVGVVGFTLKYHEKWADEAQAWLLARDLDLYTLWFKELRYEGSPGLWHTILWLAQHLFHAPYATVGIIGMAGATAGVAVMLFAAPFPRPLRWLLAFTYFMVYQYAAIARPYTLLPLLSFSAAILFKDIKHPERITIALILLASLTFHGTIIAMCLGIAYVIVVLKSWSALNERTRTRLVLCAGAMLMVLFFLFVVLKPPADVEALQEAQKMTRGASLHYFMDAIAGPFFDYPVPSVIFLALAGLWCWSRKKLTVFILPILFLVPFYVYVRGWPHQQGTIFVAVITALWIAWPEEGERKAFSDPQNLAYRGMIALLVCLFAYQAWDATFVIEHDYKFPYSGAEDAASYLKSVGAERGRIFGFLYGVVAVQAYFDHNILANYETAYFHHSSSSLAANLDPEELKAANPEYLLVPCWSEPDRAYRELYRPMMANLGYTLVHVSDGYLLTKRGWKDRQVYLVFRRKVP